MSSDVHDFKRCRLNFVQVGLGTNSTFIQNLVGWKSDFDNNIHSLLSASSEIRPERISGIAVEPVGSLLDSYRCYMHWLPNVKLLQAALGDSDRDGVEVQSVTSEVADQLLLQVKEDLRPRLFEELQYCLNMSCTGGTHPFLHQLCKKIEQEFNINISVEHQKADVWTWSRLVDTFKFKGCEVLLIDAEGNDAAILRSLIRHCQEHPGEWPQLIQFESMGLCDELEGRGTEKAVRLALEAAGYACVCWSHWNTFMIHLPAMRNTRIKKWVNGWYCTNCGADWRTPFYSNKHGIYCRPCMRFFLDEMKDEKKHAAFLDEEKRKATLALKLKLQDSSRRARCPRRSRAMPQKPRRAELSGRKTRSKVPTVKAVKRQLGQKRR